MRKSITMTVAALLTAFSGWCLADQVAAAPQSLRGADAMTSDEAPEAKGYLGKKPGLQKPIPRTFSKQPPLIPHALENFDEVTLEENQCLECHGPAKYKEKRAPKIGDSHFVDREGKKLADASNARHNCTMCHVPQVDAKPLVDNTFKGDKVPAVTKK